jgi:hypothetical protein
MSMLTLTSKTCFGVMCGCKNKYVRPVDQNGQYLASGVGCYNLVSEPDSLAV